MSKRPTPAQIRAAHKKAAPIVNGTRGDPEYWFTATGILLENLGSIDEYLAGELNSVDIAGEDYEVEITQEIADRIREFL